MLLPDLETIGITCITIYRKSEVASLSLLLAIWGQEPGHQHQERLYPTDLLIRRAEGLGLVWGRSFVFLACTVVHEKLENNSALTLHLKLSPRGHLNNVLEKQLRAPSTLSKGNSKPIGARFP